MTENLYLYTIVLHLLVRGHEHDTKLLRGFEIGPASCRPESLGAVRPDGQEEGGESNWDGGGTVSGLKRGSERSLGSSGTLGPLEGLKRWFEMERRDVRQSG